MTHTTSRVLNPGRVYFNTISRFFFKWDDVKKSPCPCLLQLVTQLWVLRSHSPPPQQHSPPNGFKSLIVSHAGLIAYSQWVEFNERVVNVRTKLGEISRELLQPLQLSWKKKKTNNSKDNLKNKQNKQNNNVKLVETRANDDDDESNRVQSLAVLLYGSADRVPTTTTKGGKKSWVLHGSGWNGMESRDNVIP